MADELSAPTPVVPIDGSASAVVTSAPNTEHRTPDASFLDGLLPRAYRQALTDPFTLRDNPVWARDARRDSRRRDRVLLLLAALGAVWLALAAAMGVLTWLARAGELRRGIPSWAGGSYGALLFVVTAGVHVWFVYHAAARRTSAFFLQEYRHNTLQTLLCTRVSPFQLVLQAALYPFCQAMVVAAAGLPFYVFAWSLGGVYLRDLLALYLLFAFIAFRPPRWVVPVFGGMTADEITKKHRKGRGTGSAEGALGGLAYGLFAGQGLLSWAFGPNWALRAMFPLWGMLPATVKPLVFGFFVTWPVMVERLLWSPLPFYAFPLPPVFLVVPLYLAARLLSAWHTSFFLRTGSEEGIAGAWDYAANRRARWGYGLALVFLLLGYLWQPYVGAGITAGLVSLHGAGVAAAQAGLLWLLGWWAAFEVWSRAAEAAGWARERRREAREAERGRLQPASARAAEMGAGGGRALRYVLGPLATVLGLYVAASLLAGDAPFPRAAALMAGRLAAITLGGGLLVAALNLRRRLWSLLLFVPLLGWCVPGPAGAWVAALSPLSGLLALSEHTQRVLSLIPYIHPVAPMWEQCAAATGLAGLLVGAVALRQGVARKVAVPAEMYGAAGEPEEAGEQKRFRVRKEYPAAQRVIGWAQRAVDNAVLTKELRVLLRGHLGPDELITALALPLTLLAVAFYYADTASDVLGYPGMVLFGPGVRGAGRILSGTIALAAGILGVAVPLAAAAAVGTGFGKERDRSTLGFILVTPMRTADIVLGKLFGLLAPSLVLLGILAVWNTALCLPLLLFATPAQTLVGWSIAAAAPLAMTLLGGVVGLASSVLFRRDSDASALAALLTIGIAAVLAFPAVAWYDAAQALLPMGLGICLWLLLLVAALLVLAPVCLALAVWRIRRARQGDVAFESAKR